MLPIILAAGSNAPLLQGLKDGVLIGIGIGMGVALFALIVLVVG
jgi:hypothetical protein